MPIDNEAILRTAFNVERIGQPNTQLWTKLLPIANLLRTLAAERKDGPLETGEELRRTQALLAEEKELLGSVLRACGKTGPDSLIFAYRRQVDALATFFAYFGVRDVPTDGLLHEEALRLVAEDQKAREKSRLEADRSTRDFVDDNLLKLEARTKELEVELAAVHLAKTNVQKETLDAFADLLHDVDMDFASDDRDPGAGLTAAIERVDALRGVLHPPKGLEEKAPAEPKARP